MNDNLNKSITYYTVAGFTMKVSLPTKLCLHSLKVHVPEVKEIDKPEQVSFHVFFIDHESSKIAINKNTLSLYGKWSTTIQADLPHLIYGFLRGKWLENQIYPVHSACIGNALFIGHSGTGKTTLCLQAQTHGMEIFSCDKTLLRFSPDKLQAIAGTDILSIRQGSSRVMQPYDRKNMAPVVINQIYLLSIDSQQENEAKVSHIEPGAAIHQLYPYFMDSTKSDVFMDNGSAILSMPLGNDHKLRLFHDLRHWLSSHHQVKFIQGSASQVLQYIKEHRNE